jgi:DNA-binding MarR family transcriptional regulator
MRDTFAGVPATCAEELLGILEAFVGQLHCRAQSAGIEALRAADLTFSQMRTLLALARNPDPVPINEIAGQLKLSMAATGRNVDQLVRTGLVDREEDGLDRRVKRISLSPQGQSLIATFKADQRRTALELLAAVDERDARRLIEALRPIVRKLGCSTRAESQASEEHQGPSEEHREHRQEIPA